MSDQKNDAIVSLELARRDIEDIDTLRKTEAFVRYFIRRLKQRRDKAAKTQYSDEKITVEEREKMRRIAREYDDLLEMMNQDYTVCQRMIEDHAASPGRPSSSSS